MFKLIKNSIRCKLCGDVIESKSRHDYVTCSCGAVFTDGGLEYLRRGHIDGKTYDEVIEDLSEWEEIDG